MKVVLYIIYRQEGEQQQQGGGGVTVDRRLLASLVQDVWDKFCNQRGVLLAREKHEAEALWLLQHQNWTDRLKEIGKMIKILKSYLFNRHRVFHPITYVNIIYSMP